MPPIRWFTNTVSRRLFSWALGKTIPDNQSGYRLLSRRLAEAALTSPEVGFAFEVDEIAICVGRGYRLAWVPIKTIYGEETSDIKPWVHFVSFLRVTRRARRRAAGRSGGARLLDLSANSVHGMGGVSHAHIGAARLDQGDEVADGRAREACRSDWRPRRYPAASSPEKTPSLAGPAKRVSTAVPVLPGAPS